MTRVVQAKILKEAKNDKKSMESHIFLPKNVIFERFKPLSKLHSPACTTLHMKIEFQNF